ACHDLSEGGLAVAAAEMALAGRLGLELSLSSLPHCNDVERDDVALFSESAGRFLIEVAPADAAAFEEMLAGIPHTCLGQVVEQELLKVRGLNDVAVLSCAIADLARAWKEVP
ncbi:MAG: phosphoribosylformylglycinamidine synthase, partial [Anaerolineae bacterium]|nr:phosphoribosylformylglycinamidine synthase [Anaerolineae bacterium]